MLDTNGDVPEELQEEKGYAKIGVAVAVTGTIVGSFVGVAVGVIPPDNPAVQHTLTLFVAFAGAVAGFLYKKVAG